MSAPRGPRRHSLSSIEAVQYFPTPLPQSHKPKPQKTSPPHKVSDTTKPNVSRVGRLMEELDKIEEVFLNRATPEEPTPPPNLYGYRHQTSPPLPRKLQPIRSNTPPLAKQPSISQTRASSPTKQTRNTANRPSTTPNTSPTLTTTPTFTRPSTTPNSASTATTTRSASPEKRHHSDGMLNTFILRGRSTSVEGDPRTVERIRRKHAQDKAKRVVVANQFTEAQDLLPALYPPYCQDTPRLRFYNADSVLSHKDKLRVNAILD